MENFEFENKKKKKIKKDAIYLCLCVVCLVIGGLCHKGSAQGRYGQCAGRLQCHETDQRRKEGTGCAGFLSGCVHRPYVYANANPV